MSGAAELRWQVAVVTRASRGFGRAYARALARAGAAVALVARTAPVLDALVDELAAAERRALPLAVDVTDPRAVARAAARVTEELGPVDLPVNAAGIGGPMGPFADSPVEAWWRTLEVNLKGPALWAQALLPGMLARRRGRIVNVASRAGTRAIPYFSSYVTSKTALIRLSETLAMEGAAAGVRVFPIEPGTARTAMTEQALDTEAGRRWLPWFAGIFERGEDVSLERSAAFVLRIARGEADALSGRLITVHGDLAALASAAVRITSGDALALRLVGPALAS